VFVVGFLVDLVSSVVLAPFKLVRFMIVDVLVRGILGTLASLMRAVLRALLHPLTLVVIASGVAAYLYASEEQKKKVKSLLGM